MTNSLPGSASKQASDADITPEFDLNLPADILAIAECFRNEWCNGGFAQLFCNWRPVDVKLISQGLRGVGAPEAAVIVEKAIAELGTPDQWQHQGHRALLEPSYPLRQRLWELNRQLDPYEQNLSVLIADYELKLGKSEDANHN